MNALQQEIADALADEFGALAAEWIGKNKARLATLDVSDLPALGARLKQGFADALLHAPTDADALRARLTAATQDTPTAAETIMGKLDEIQDAQEVEKKAREKREKSPIPVTIIAPTPVPVKIEADKIADAVVAAIDDKKKDAP
jgi:hypothetical protein